MLNDLRHSLRLLLKHPGFTTVAILTLALGIGANTAIFSVVDKLLARPLPVPQPNQLALVAQEFRQGQPEFEFNYPLFRDYQRAESGFSELSATGEMAVGVGAGGATERENALLVSGNYFRMLGVNAALGRVFAANEGVEIDDAPVAVISHGLWRRRFGADPGAIGRNVIINGHPFTIVGVAPREFTGTKRGTVPDLYLPITMYGQLTAERPGGENPLATRFFTWHEVMGRLKPGVSAAQAQAGMNILARQFNAATPANTATNVVLLSGAQGFTNDLRETRLPLYLLMATAGLVLLIACANLANLQLTRATARARDCAIRLALGAGRARLMRQLLVENVMLSLMGGGLGLLVAIWLTESLNRFRPPGSAIELTSGLDSRVLAFALLVSVVTGVIFGLAPAWRSGRVDVVPELKGAAGDGHRRRFSVRGGLVVTQVALSFLVLISAGLCLRSLRKLQQVDPGFEPSWVVMFSFDLQLNNYANPAAMAFYDQLIERVRALPGVESASLARSTPLDGNRMGMSIDRIEGYEQQGGKHPAADLNMITPDFFRTFGVSLREGRDFNRLDLAGGVKSVMVNEAFVQRFWPGQPAVGKRLFQRAPEGTGNEVWEVVGVVSSVARQLRDMPRPVMFRLLAQWLEKSLTLAIRTGLSPSLTIPQVRELVKSIDANVPVFGVRTMEQQRDGSLALQRMAATLLGGFGALALLLAALGIYGVLAYSVSLRTREIGVRMALGAQLGDVLSLVLKQGVILVVVGMILGLAGAGVVTNLLRSFLFEVKPLDPLTFGGVMVLLIAVAVPACWLPARRAARVDPMIALRHE